MNRVVLSRTLFCSALLLAPVLPLLSQAASPTTRLTAVWANEGGDKVTQDELRATKKQENVTGTVLNRAWDGSTIRLTGARNESVSFNLVLEAATLPATNVSVSFNTLTGPSGATIQTAKAATGNDVFSWVGRPIELFYTRYLQIKAVSAFGYFHGSENQMPLRFQAASHRWTDRPDHDKYYPDILVPLELVPTFTIAGGQNQSVWADIYIPKTTVAGTYTGTVTIKEGGAVTKTVPVSLTVQPFTLPETPSTPGFSYLDANEIGTRYIMPGYINWSTPQAARQRAINDTYFKLFHRHRIELIGGESETQPVTGIHPYFLPRYNGSLFTAAHGYDGPGVGLGMSIYSYGSYGTWNRAIADSASMWKMADPLGAWFKQNLPHVLPFIYLQDEPPASDHPKLANWSKWLVTDPGPGRGLFSMATVSVGTAVNAIPDLQIVTNGTGIGECPKTAPNSCDNVAYTGQMVSQFKSNPTHHLWQYGAGHPGVGTTNTEDDGIAMRTVAWAQYKLGIERWFSWYANLNTQMDWFQSACTWGCAGAHVDGQWGVSSDGAFTNGNGVLVYPGTDIGHRSSSYGVEGPFASLRLKEWRRGIEDGDYLALAHTFDPAATAAVVQKVMPAALWENKAPGWPKGDPSYFNGPVSWSANPDAWEAARADLAAIIVKGCGAKPTTTGCR